MRKWYFWSSWNPVHRDFYWFALTVFLFSLAYFIYSYFAGVNNVIHWETVDKLSQLKTAVHSFTAGNIKLDIPLDNYVIFQYFRGSDLTIYPGLSYFYLIILVLSMNLIMSLLPGMSKFWFYAGMGGFIGLMVLFQLNQIELFGERDKSALIIVLGLYLSAGYYFREFNGKASLLVRYLVFTGVAILIGILFYFYAGVEAPFLYIANYGIYGPVILSVLFIFSIAHEIVYGILFLITDANTTGSKNSMAHFLFASILFLVYVFITFLSFTHQVQWNLVNLNPFLVLTVCVLIGIYGLKQREELFREIFPYNPTGALFYLAFAAFSFTTIAYVFSVANDPLIEVFEDAILYSQIGFGVMFFLYILANFSPLLIKNYRVVKIVYQSRIFPFFVFRIGGLMVVGYIFFEAHFFPYYQSLAGYYNNVGDLFLMNRNLRLAGQYYREASDFEFQNHRSNYALATIARLQKNKLDQSYYFQNSILKRPSEYAYVNLSNVLMENNQYFEGLFQLKDGQEQFPSSYEILNNLGYFYSKTDIADSAFYYFNLASNARRRSVSASNNIFALLPKSDLYFDIDSLEDYYHTYNNDVGRANKLGMINKYHLTRQTAEIKFKNDLTSDKDFALIYNAGIHKLHSDDSTYFNRIGQLADSVSSPVYENRLHLLYAVYMYLTHRTARAYRILQSLGESLAMNDEYYTILAKMSLEQHRPRLAVEFLEKTDIDLEPGNRLLMALANLDAGQHDKAEHAFLLLKNSGDTDLAAVANEYLLAIDSDTGLTTDSLTDEVKYLKVRYPAPDTDEKTLSDLIKGISNPAVKALACVDHARAMLMSGDTLSARQYYREYLELNIQGSDDLKNKAGRLTYLMDLHDPDRKRVYSSNRLSIDDPDYLYDMLLDIRNGGESYDSAELARKYRILATWDPFFDEGIAAAADYYYSIYPDGYKSYNVLTEAMVYNPYSVSLTMKFIEICINMSLFDYANDALVNLGDIMNPVPYRNYRNEIQRRINAKQNENNAWYQ